MEYRKCSRCNGWMQVGEYATCDLCRAYLKEYREQNAEWLAYRQHLRYMSKPRPLPEVQPLKTHVDRLNERRTESYGQDLLAEALLRATANRHTRDW